MGKIINPFQFIVERLRAQNEALRAIPVAEMIDARSDPVRLAALVDPVAFPHLSSGSPVTEINPVRVERVEAQVKSAGSVREVLAVVSESGLVLNPAQGLGVSQRLEPLFAGSDLVEAKAASLELVESVLVPAHQEVFEESLRSGLVPALREIEGVSVSDHGGQLVAESESGELIVEPVVSSDGSVALNVAADYEDGTCHHKVEELRENLLRAGIEVSQPRILPKAPPQALSLRLRRQRRMNQVRL